MRRRSLIAGGLAGAAALCSVMALGRYPARAAVTAAQEPVPRSDPGIGGSFTLIDQAGRPVSDRDFRGKPLAIVFGYTYCPEVCPTTLAALGAELRALGPAADRLNAAFVTLDPQRDTPRRLARYLAAFDPRIRGLTGTPAQIARIAAAFDVYYQKVPSEGGGYSLDHSTGVYLMTANGRAADMIGYREPLGDAVEKLRALVKG